MSLLHYIFPNARRQGDLARSLKAWSDAEAYYRRHLKRRPDDTAIWVQLGHALKEQGFFASAVDAYGSAHALTTEDDHDLAIHYAFVLDKVQRRRKAREVLLDAYAIRPDEGLRGRIVDLDDREHVDWEVKGDGAIFFSVHDLLGYLKEFPTMSGIQRVQAGVAFHAISNDTAQSYFIVNSVTGSRDTLAAGEFWLLANEDLQGIIAYASGLEVDHPQLRRLILAAEERARKVRPGRGNIVVLLGAFWGLGNSVQAFVPCWQAGAKIGAYIYDIIPITHPQYCDPGLVRDFTMCFSEICAIADFFLTISDFTGRVVRDFIAFNGLPEIPTATVPLAHSLTGASHVGSKLPATLLRKLGGRDFVAYVSTIEGRKNHLYVLKSWIEMKDRGMAVPDLVFVGRRGWRVGDLFDLLKKTNYLDRQVHILHDLTDGELDAIYRNSLFTVFTSHVEGWGLPVGESLVHGVPCIASNSSSIPEVGGDFVDYVDIDDIAGGIRLFRQAITSPKFLAERRARIASDFRPRNWDEVSADFVAKVILFSRDDRRPRELRAHIPYGTLMRLNVLAQPIEDLADYIHNPWRLLLSSFYQPEAMGAWMRGSAGEIRLDTGLPEGCEIDMHLHIAAAPWADKVALEIVADSRPADAGRGSVASLKDMASDGLQAFRRFDLAEVRFSGGRRLQLRVGPSGVCTLRFSLTGRYKMAPQDARQFVMGLTQIGFVRSNDDRGRTTLLESYFVQSLGAAQAIASNGDEVL